MEQISEMQIIDWLALAVALYEAIARAIPTVKNFTILGRIINFVKLVSDKLDSRKDEVTSTRRIRRSKS
jgi:hypothetical protein